MAVLAQLVDGVVATRFDIPEGQLTLGRHPTNDVQIDEEAVSSRHARILTERNSHFRDYREYYLEDLNSTNGTFVNGSRVNSKQRLHHNDEIRLAWNRFKFFDEAELELAKTAHIISDDH